MSRDGFVILRGCLRSRFCHPEVLRRILLRSQSWRDASEYLSMTTYGRPLLRQPLSGTHGNPLGIARISRRKEACSGPEMLRGVPLSMTVLDVHSAFRL